MRGDISMRRAALVNVFINTYVHFTTSTTTYHELAYFCENEKSSYQYID